MSTPPTPPLRVGLIGFGFAGQTFHAPLIAATPGLQLAAIASSDAAKVRAAWGEAMPVETPASLIARDDIDLIVIATPNDSHHPLALAALQADRHVLVDKPFAVTLEQARELCEVASARGRVLSVFHNRRWDSDFLTLKQVLASGRLGRVTFVASHFDRYRPQPRARWREGNALGAGLWMDLGPHLLDQALQLFGMPQAMGVDIAAARNGALADDFFHAALRWTEGPHAGLRVHLHATALAAAPGARFTVHGTDGSFTVDGLDGQEAKLKALVQSGRPVDAIASASWGAEKREARLWTGEDEALHATPLPLRPGAYPAFFAALRDAILGHGPNPVAGEETLQVMALLELGQRSAAERRELSVTGL
jgi:predicted dehydrogenase